MAGQTIQTTIAINATVGNGFSKAGATLTELGTLVNGVSQQLIEFGKDSIGVYRDYEMSMTDAEVALSTTYGRGTTQLSSVMTQLDAAATEWAATTIFHTNDVGNAIAEAAHAGWDLDQIMSGIPAAMQLAQAGGIDLSEAVNYIVKATSAAGIGFEDMGNFIDLWAFAANSSATNIDEMGEAMLRMGSTMRFAGNPEELMTLIAVTANAGTVGSAAGTLIRNSMLRLIAPTDKAKEAMGELGATSEETAEIMGDEQLAAANARLAAQGFSAYDENGQLKSTLDTYRDLYVSLGEIAGGYENIEKNEDALGILAAIFPTRTITEALTLLRGAAEGYDGLYEAMMGGDAEGYGQYAADTMMDTLNGKIETFESKVERLKQLTGEELSGPLESLLGTLGGFVDTISGMDDGAFSVLVGGLTGLATAGPGLFIAAGAMRFIGAFVANPALVGGALGVAALAAALGALAAYSDVQFEGNFGQLELDLTTLKTNVDNLTTDAEEEYGQLKEHTDKINQLATEYQTAVTNFNSELATDVLTGKTLSKEDIGKLKGYGKALSDTVIQGIQESRQKSQTFLNLILGDTAEEGEFETYSDLYDSETEYYGGLLGEAQQIGEQIQQAIAKGLENDGVLDEAERSIIQDLEGRLNRIQAEIAERTAQADYYAGLEKAGRVSKDSMDEYMEYLAQNHADRTEEMNTLFDEQLGVARASYEKDLGHAVTDEEWQATDQYALIQQARQEAIQQIAEQTASLAQTAFNTLMGDSDLADSWAFARRVMEEAPKDENGNVDYDNIDWAGYIQRGEVPENFYKNLDTLQHGSWLFGLGPSEFGKMLEPWKDLPGVSEMYDMFSGGFFEGSGLGNLEGSAANFQQEHGGWTSSGQFGEFNEGHELEATVHADTSEVNSEIQSVQPDPIEAPVEPEVQGETQSPTMDPIPVEIKPYASGTDPVLGLAEQGVDVQVGGDVQQLTADITGFQGYNLMTYVDGDVSNLSAAITTQDGRTVRINGDASAVGSAIAAYENKTITVNIKANRMFSLPGSTSGYAEGGRATTASIFGEAGPEWAIPEEHSDSTAQLLDAARAASGFTWAELLARNGGLNANPTGTSRTLVYAPTIYAQNAEGVDEVLQQNKEQMDKWYREREMRDQMEVYA